jgi:AAA15 family ATPase/GTPase
MILRATFDNIYSIKDETQISFVAGKSNVHGEHVSRAEKRDDISVLKAGVVYGANASGKSNIIKAIALLQQIACGCFPQNKMEPFKLADTENRSSKIEVEFKTMGKCYAYGVEFTIGGIKEEWLFEINSRTDKEIFSRKVSAEGNEFSFGKVEGNEETKMLLKFLAHGTPGDTSFLSEYVRRNGVGLDAIKVAKTWFADGLKIIFPSTRLQGISFLTENNEELRSTTRSLLGYFNTGIADVRLYKMKKDEINLQPEALDNILSRAKAGKPYSMAATIGGEMFLFEVNASGSYEIFKQKAVHRNLTTGEEVVFELGEESDGSIRLLDFIPMLIDLKQNEVDYLIDEIDRSMHPMLSQKILECYFSGLDANRDTQLIFSTHECNLLNLDLIRADEVWFVEKGKDGASHLTSLAEYKPREDVRKGYLQGRYGAIPFFAPIQSLKW